MEMRGERDMEKGENGGRRDDREGKGNLTPWLACF